VLQHSQAQDESVCLGESHLGYPVLDQPAESGQFRPAYLTSFFVSHHQNFNNHGPCIISSLLYDGLSTSIHHGVNQSFTMGVCDLLVASQQCLSFRDTWRGFNVSGCERN
jgi:hypothetical protein